jgi:cytochrome c
MLRVLFLALVLCSAAAKAELRGHGGPVRALAASSDGRLALSGSFDQSAIVWDVERGAALAVLRFHEGAVNAVAALPDGRFATAGEDGRIALWRLGLGTPEQVIEAHQGPVVGLTVSPDGENLASASWDGTARVTALATGTARVLSGHKGNVNAVAFLPDGKELLTGGSDRLVRRWDMTSGEHIGPVVLSRPEDFLAGFQGDRGAEVFQACAACHTLTPDGGNRAGPTLHGLFGRRIATLPGYNFSPALKHLDIVWTPETVQKLFEVGPAQYTPGTKMPEQVILSPADREALVRFLEKATR